MWKRSVIAVFVSAFVLLVAMQGCYTKALGVPFHGYIPSSKVKALPPRGDGGPNDIYSHLPIRQRELSNDELVVYPTFVGFEEGKDFERKVYEVMQLKDLVSGAFQRGTRPFLVSTP